MSKFWSLSAGCYHKLFVKCGHPIVCWRKKLQFFVCYIIGSVAYSTAWPQPQRSVAAASFVQNGFRCVPSWQHDDWLAIALCYNSYS